MVLEVPLAIVFHSIFKIPKADRIIHIKISI